jgi:hypothetical protein
METINLGEIPVCNEAVTLPLAADTTGEWTFVSNFNGAYQYLKFQATATQPLVVPVRLNEHYTYIIKLYKPGGDLFNDVHYCATTIPMLPDIEYACQPVEGTSITQLRTGRKQFTATDGQSTIGDNLFINAIQIVVFVEGALKQEGTGAEDYGFNAISGTITFNTALIEGQKITVIYFR